MILNTEVLRDLLVRELLWPTGTERREHTAEERQAAAKRADAVIQRYTRRVYELAYKDVSGAYRDDRNRGR